MKQTDKYLESVSIDSFKYRIELTELDWYCDSLLDHYGEVNLTTSEVIESSDNFKLKAKQYKEKGVTTYFKVENGIRVTKDRTANVLVILINAKLLKGIAYFEGITPGNIESIYNQLMSLEVFKCSLSAFLKYGKVTDCDYKLDAKMNIEQYKEVLSQMKSMIKLKPNVVTRTKFKGKDNIGLQLNERKATNYKSSPFLKIYNKSADLKYNSREFKDSYLSGVDCNDIVRIETTVKNNEHFKSLGIKNNSLENVLNASDEIRNNIVKSAVSKYMNVAKRVKTKMRDPNKLTPTETLICQGLIATMEGLNMSYQNAVKYTIAPIESKVSRSRMKALLDKIYLGQIKGQDLDKKLEQTDTYFRLLGIS